ncbi:hypothetical protein PHLH6_47530 [Pseudomonas sp. Seg1]|nr:hypothetical protein PHLH6_47530 [Pseudomonas sp. Seg1]
MNNYLTVRDLLPAEVESVRVFLGQHGWGHRTGSSEDFAQLIANSQRTAIALKGTCIAGFARGISDGLSNGYLSMVVVDGQHRREGIGRALVEHVMGITPTSPGCCAQAVKAPRRFLPAWVFKRR